MSILDGLKDGGLFIHPYNEELITNKLDDAIRDQTFGLEEVADIQALDVIEEMESTKFTVHLHDVDEMESMEITIPVPGNIMSIML